MAYLNRKKRYKNLSFLTHVRNICKQRKIKFLLSKHSVVNAKESPTSGYYDAGSRYLTVAKGKNPRKNWLSVLVHEYSHVEQEIDKDPVFYTEIKNKDNDAAEYILDMFLMGKKKLSYKQLDLVIKKIVISEHNCEKRAVKNIRKFKLGLDKKKYIQEANAYLFYYYFVKEAKFWVPAKIAAYHQDFIVDNMPTEILPFNQYKKLYKKQYHNLFKTVYL